MAYESDAPWRLTRQVQAMLGIREDGIWGQQTQVRFDGASEGTRRQILALLERESLSPYSVARVTSQVREPAKASRSNSRPAAGQLKTVSVAAKPPGRSGGWHTLADLEPALREAVSGLSYATYDRMVAKLKLEAGQRKVNGVVEYNANSVNGRYRGLFQMGEKAWKDVSRLLGRSYDEVFNPAVNARAAALYIENNVQVARRMGYKGPITDAVIYAMHNQGVTGFMMTVDGRSIEGDQSRPARGVIASAVRDARSGSV